MTGSFKLRGALAKVAALGERARAGLVTASAGNHARAVAQAARVRGRRLRGVHAARRAPSRRSPRSSGWARASTSAAPRSRRRSRWPRERRRATGAAFVHPFDDLDVIAGQGTLGLELLEDVPDLARVVVPVGGGGLASGVGIALRRASAPTSSSSACRRAPARPTRRALNASAPRPRRAAGRGHDRRRHRAQAPRRADAAAAARAARDLRHGQRGGDRRRDGVPRRARQARRRGRRRGRRRRAHRAGRLAPVAGTTVAIVSGGNVDSGLLAGLLRRQRNGRGPARAHLHARARPARGRSPSCSA